ncbi:MAG TPA: hypothetical protein VF666_16560 [Pyrinomonadaceae bacterium]
MAALEDRWNEASLADFPRTRGDEERSSYRAGTVQSHSSGTI